MNTLRHDVWIEVLAELAIQDSSNAIYGILKAQLIERMGAGIVTSAMVAVMTAELARDTPFQANRSNVRAKDSKVTIRALTTTIMAIRAKELHPERSLYDDILPQLASEWGVSEDTAKKDYGKYHKEYIRLFEKHIEANAKRSADDFVNRMLKG